MKANDTMTAAQIRASLEVSAGTLREAEQILKAIFEEESLPESTHRPYLEERKNGALDLIADILANRARLRQMLRIKENL